MSTIDEKFNHFFEQITKSQQEQTDKVLAELKDIKLAQNEKIKKLEKTLINLENKYLSLERRIRKNNIIIFGLKIDKQNLIEETIAILNSLLGISLNKTEVINCYVIGKYESKQGILLELSTYFKKLEIYQNVTKLKGKSITIVNDLCDEDQATNRILRKYLKIAKQNNKQARIRGNTLEIESKFYTVEELEKKGVEETVSSENEDSEEDEELNPEKERPGSSKFKSTEVTKRTRNQKITHSKRSNRHKKY